MTPTTEISHTIQVAMVVLFFFVAGWAALVWGAEPELKRQDLAMQEASVSWK